MKKAAAGRIGSRNEEFVLHRQKLVTWEENRLRSKFIPAIRIPSSKISPLSTPKRAAQRCSTVEHTDQTGGRGRYDLSTPSFNLHSCKATAMP
jgi:hypothetical protein